MKALIFGANGQDGFYLQRILASKGVETIGISRKHSDHPFIRQGNITDFESTEKLIHEHQPDYIFHLAANSTTRHDALMENHETISTGTLNILEAARRHSFHSKIFITGSGVQFKNTGAPIKETDPFQANNAYSISRIQSVYAARYFRTLGMRTFVGYLFHHESPFRKEHHVAKMIASHVIGVSQGGKTKIKLGDILVKKEWAFAEDISEGILALVEQDTVYEATIGTGIGYTIQDWISVCFNLIQKNWQDYIEFSDPNFQAEYKSLISEPSTIHGLGWSAKTSLEKLAEIMIFDTGQGKF